MKKPRIIPCCLLTHIVVFEKGKLLEKIEGHYGGEKKDILAEKNKGDNWIGKS